MLTKGKCYYVRTVTDHWVGKVEECLGPFCVKLTEAAWIANSGRLHTFCATGKAEQMEVEPVGTIVVQWLAAIEWPHATFKKAV